MSGPPPLPPCAPAILGATIPGAAVRIGTVTMDFCTAGSFGSPPTTGCETLLYHAMNRDATLFVRADGVERGRSVVARLLDVWKALPPRTFPNHAAGTWDG